MSDQKIFIHIPKNAGMTIRHSDKLRGKILINNPSRHINQQYTSKLYDKMHATGDHHGAEHARWRDLDTNYRDSIPLLRLLGILGIVLFLVTFLRRR